MKKVWQLPDLPKEVNVTGFIVRSILIVDGSQQEKI
jgi:hypothetical protein